MTRRTPGLRKDTGFGSGTVYRDPWFSRFFYDLVFLVFSVFYVPFFFIKGKHKEGIWSRFGILDKEIKEHFFDKKVIWVHGVSVGEAVQAVRLADALKDKLKDFTFLITTTTATGREVAQKLKSDEDVVLYFPVDFRTCVRSFIRSVAPQAVLVLETEIWPNLVYELSNAGIPVFLMNARISDRAFSRYWKVKKFLRPVLNRFALIAAQDETMRKRFLKLGAAPELVGVTGNMKFDWQPEMSEDEAIEKLASVVRRPETFLWIAGSTHEGEEDILFEVYKSLKAKYDFLRLLVAPRHLDRLSAIEAKAREKNVILRKLTALSTASGHDSAFSENEVFILDKMGILAGTYRLADAVFVGGSLVPSGGHNLAEPAFFEKAILFGPHMSNFREMAEEFKKENAGIEVQGREALEATLERWIRNPEEARGFGTRARRLVTQHQGATQKNVSRFLNLAKF